MTAPGIEVRALEAFADLLFAVDSDEPTAAFYDRLCEATCRLAGMNRAAIFLYDEAVRRVRAVGSHGIELSRLRDVHARAEDTPIALRALSEDRVVEVRGDPTGQVPDQYLGLVSYPGLVCTPISAAGRWPGVILSDRADARPLTDEERHLLWTLGKVAALAASARLATREQERARQLQDRIDLAREIHDGVIQRLFGVSMALSLGGDLSAEERRRCAAEIQDALADLRRAVQRPLGREPRETPTTLLEEVRRLGREHPELHVELDGGADGDVPPEVEPLAQSVLTEALRNASKHASPTRVGVSVMRDGDAFVLEVVNDGVRSTGRRGHMGMGLRLAAFEALHHGGVIEFGPDDDDRWRVRLIVPHAGGPA
jgi:signal transduction histidine kinase